MKRPRLRFADAPAIVIFLAILAYIIAGAAERLENDLIWESAELATAAIDGETLSGIAIPEAALHRDGEGVYVWVMTAGRAEKKTINLIHAEGGLFLAETGSDPRSLRPGDRLITGGSGIYEGKILT